MVFTSPFFVFLFLPLVLAIHALLPAKLRNAWLLLASLFFYAWGERLFTVIMLASILLNYTFGRLLEHYRGRRLMKPVVVVAILANVLLLAVFKYANFVVDSLNLFLHWIKVPAIHLAPVHLPAGISFFTFHALSYVIDIYRNQTRGQKNFVDVALYVTLFPQLIAGPILRFHNIARQLISRRVDLPLFSEGVRRFIIGFSKKMLLANTVAAAADSIFAAPAATLSPAAAWLGITCYALQIYFDFSGYSDMAIGMGRMLGFYFPENFNYPYISRSIRDFWRRWHISLSTWFRDYVYIPLGGNRVAGGRAYFNLAAVFLLCGLWHGASWTFVIWGLYHGMFLIFERLGWSRVLERAWSPLAHAYTLLAMTVGWVFFRSDTLGHALGYLSAMFGFGKMGGTQVFFVTYLDRKVLAALIIGCFAATPLPAYVWTLAKRQARSVGMRMTFDLGEAVSLLAIFLLSLCFVATETYNPFIYFRF